MSWGLLASAADVDLRLSSREAYVGAPIVLQLDIVNAESYQPPTLPQIDGLQIRSVGAPSQSSQITIINGRRSERRSISLQYEITPNRAGTYELPPLTLDVDGKRIETESITFVATKSDTGDLLFVEVEGKKKKVYVGEPLELTLKIWLKPFRDRENRIRLDEEQMWRTLARGTSWGSFSDRMQELAENNQRPGGHEVLRDDGEGNQGSYFLYEINATIYPNHPGTIDADDVQVVVEYPTTLDRRRSSFGRLSQMFDDDLFGSTFGDELVITATRPIVAGAQVDATQVLPIPMVGRPPDYRGAVGKYEIFTQARPTSVKAGDPITLDIGINGSGPMQLVQSPPLAELKQVTDDFKVSNQPLAGYVRNHTKLFTTTIRPRREGITEIPPIPLSFFNPETQSFETVLSEPIPITVTQSDSLSLDSIVSTNESSSNFEPASDDAPTNGTDSATSSTAEPNFRNNDSLTVLQNQTRQSATNWWLPWLVVPAFLWLVVFVLRYWHELAEWISSFGSAHKRCITKIRSATSRDEILDAIRVFLGKENSSLSDAIGGLRMRGQYPLAAEVETYVALLQRNGIIEPTGEQLQNWKENACELVNRVDAVLRSRGHRVAGRSTVSSTKRMTASVGMLCAVSWASHSIASDSYVDLTVEQQQAILQEASTAYATAMNISDEQPAEAKEGFATAATKYQLLVDAGIRNSDLYLNLGNAYLQSGELGRAIAHYEKAKLYSPDDSKIDSHLRYAATKVYDGSSQLEEMDNNVIVMLVAIIDRWAQPRLIIATMLVSSTLFWLIAILRTLGYRFAFLRIAIVPLVPFAISVALIFVLPSNRAQHSLGIVVVDEITLRGGDGEAFAPLATIQRAQGRRVEVVANRGGWVKIRTTDNQIGWTEDRSLIQVNT